MGAESFAAFERIKEIIQEQRALEKHQQQQGAGFDQIESSRVDAYRHIVQLVTGVDIYRAGQSGTPC